MTTHITTTCTNFVKASPARRSSDRGNNFGKTSETARGRRALEMCMPGASLLRRRRGDVAVEDVLTLQRQLERISDARHVMAAAGPPDHVEHLHRPEMTPQLLAVGVGDAPRLLRQLPREGEGHA